VRGNRGENYENAKTHIKKKREFWGYYKSRVFCNAQAYKALKPKLLCVLHLLL
jgi:hypothetical protein